MFVGDKFAIFTIERGTGGKIPHWTIKAWNEAAQESFCWQPDHKEFNTKAEGSFEVWLHQQPGVRIPIEREAHEGNKVLLGGLWTMHNTILESWKFKDPESLLFQEASDVQFRGTRKGSYS